MKPEVISTIYPATIAKRKLPVNFDQDQLALFEGELEREIPETQLLKFQNVLASPEGLLFTGAKILPESFAFPYHLDDWPFRSVLKFLATNYLSRRRRKLPYEALWITDYWSTGYFHWLTDALTRLFVVQDRLRDLLLVLPAKYAECDFVAPTLHAFGATRINFIYGYERVKLRRVLMPSHTAPPGHFKREAIRGVRNVLLSAYGDSTAEGERIYISRRRATKRKIANEDELIPVLNNFGFQVIRAEELSFAEQVRVCSRARYIVSNHGAGLTNALFMKERGSVLELRHQADCINNCYFTMCSALDLDYFYQTCAPQNAGLDPHEADLIVDPAELERNLRLLLA